MHADHPVARATPIRARRSQLISIVQTCFSIAY